MFAQLDARNGSRRRRAWMTLLSFLLEAFALTLLVALPLLYTAALPRPQWMGRLFAPPAAAASRGVPKVIHDPGHNSPRPNDAQQPTVIYLQNPPHRGPVTADDQSSHGQDPIGLQDGTLGSTGDAKVGLLLGIPEHGSPPPTPPKSQPLAPVRISQLDPGNLITRVQPQYPHTAQIAHLEGSVVLAALIARDGSVQRLRVTSGHPLLAQAALDAVRQWRFRPYLLNGEAVEVETEITVHFVLGQR